HQAILAASKGRRILRRKVAKLKLLHPFRKLGARRLFEVEGGEDLRNRNAGAYGARNQYLLVQ
ncbi:hypothetical protein, partial [Bradyrhizobium retamae]|uniref:hypothetical protein n=1 Tax=Bradyrhizobium retamae TaxID=1300035 RepID=UPI000A99306B